MSDHEEVHKDNHALRVDRWLAEADDLHQSTRSRNRQQPLSNDGSLAFTGTIQVGSLRNPNDLGHSSPRTGETETTKSRLEVSDEEEAYITQLKTRPIEHLQLVAEVKGDLCWLGHGGIQVHRSGQGAKHANGCQAEQRAVTRCM
ncbi:hypothetical protein PG993_014247 [Apiospora rasikravindrae]|uniref:Uncharacterized protein n=1 Tax=Apiospora rasikravindrae TaxID=990691 RepID=A0ABR1RM86_9PEZI